MFYEKLGVRFEVLEKSIHVFVECSGKTNLHRGLQSKVVSLGLRKINFEILVFDYLWGDRLAVGKKNKQTSTDAVPWHARRWLADVVLRDADHGPSAIASTSGTQGSALS